MGFFDRAKRFLGVGSQEDDEQDGDTVPGGPREGENGERDRGGDPRAAARRKGERKRPAFTEAQQAQTQSVEDAIAAREAGDRALARKILDEIDRGSGLRTVLRAAAALEERDTAALRELLPAVAREEPRWRLLLQVAAALGEPAAAAPLLARAEREGAPAWALAWSRALSSDEAARREGLVELLFTDAPLARTVAARDLSIPGVASDASAAQRYAAFVHGRDSIRRFGAATVASLLDEAAAVGGP